MLQRILEKRYETREAFIQDLNLLVQNSELYNGPKSVLTDTAKKMLDLCLERIAEVCFCFDFEGRFYDDVMPRIVFPCSIFRKRRG